MAAVAEVASGILLAIDESDRQLDKQDEASISCPTHHGELKHLVAEPEASPPSTGASPASARVDTEPPLSSSVVLRKQAEEHRNVARLLRQAAAQQASLLPVLQGVAKEELEEDMCTQLAQAEGQEETAASKEAQALELECGEKEPPTPQHAPPPDAPTPGRPAQYVTATLRRDSSGLFRFQLKEDTDGAVYISGLPESDAGDDRALLRRGDLLRAVGGRAVSTLSLSETKGLVKEAGETLELYVFRMGELPQGEDAPLQQALGQLQRLGMAAGREIHQLVSASKDQLEEGERSLQQAIHEVQGTIKEVQGTVGEALGGGLTQQLQQQASEIGTRAADFGNEVASIWGGFISSFGGDERLRQTDDAHQTEAHAAAPETPVVTQT